jgi:L-amino acid N-acyltransferase YncA
MTMGYRHKSLPSTLSAIRHVGTRRAAQTAVGRSWGTNTFFGLAVDLSALPDVPPSEIGIVMEPVESRSFGGFKQALTGISRDEAPELLARDRLCRANVTTLFVGRSRDGQNIYAQWLVSAGELASAGRLLSIARPLAERESLVEGAYTFPHGRGKGAMRDGMAQLIRVARARNDSRVITYVHEGNIASLRGCAAVGFQIDHVRTDVWRLGHLARRFGPASSEHRQQWATLTKAH